MARYDWECRQCATRTVVDRRMADSDVGPNVPCTCGATEYKKIIILDNHSKNYILLGTGWHDQEYSKTRSIK